MDHWMFTFTSTSPRNNTMTSLAVPVAESIFPLAPCGGNPVATSRNFNLWSWWDTILPKFGTATLNGVLDNLVYRVLISTPKIRPAFGLELRFWRRLMPAVFRLQRLHKQFKLGFELGVVSFPASEISSQP